MPDISRNFNFDTGLTQVWTSKTMPTDLLPKELSSLLPSDDQPEQSSLLSSVSESLQKRSLDALRPDLGDTPQVVLPIVYNNLRQTLTHHFAEPSPELKQILRGSDSDDTLCEALHTIFTDMAANYSLLEDSRNALRLA